MRDLILPQWPAPRNVVALSTSRLGGCSAPPYDSLNLGDNVGDEPDHVARNRSLLQGALPPGSDIQWLRQVHGTRVVEAGTCGLLPEADGVWSAAPGRTCAVLTADCLPVLLCSRQGDAVAAAHAGWRGLAGGVLEHTVAAMPCAPQALIAWLGPCIGPAAFDVGEEVVQAFLQGEERASGPIGAAFTPHPSRPGYYRGNLHALARLRLERLGVSAVFAVSACTASDADRFFSYRRDGRTGRMASVIALR